MIATPRSPAHQGSRRAIDAHFAGRAPPAVEAAMRTHLGTCAPCKGYYQRHLTLAQLDPEAPGAQERIARTLGFGVGNDRARRRQAWLAVGLAVPAAAAIALLPGHWARRAPEVERAGEFAARSASASVASRPALWTYRVDAAGGARLADGAIRAGDELAFAYSNPTAKPFLMVFGIDEHRDVYWFHPAWPAGASAPVAIRAAPGTGPHELPDAIRHRIDGRELQVCASFAERAIGATTIEAAARRAGAVGAPLDLGDGVATICRTFRVLP